MVKQEMEYLESYLQIETGSVERIEVERYFAGLEGGMLREWGRKVGRTGEVGLREGWWRVWGWLLRHQEEERDGGGKGKVRVDVKVGVISVSWSKEWIRGLLEGGWELWKETNRGKVEVEEGVGGGLRELEIYANEFIVDPETGLTTGQFSRRKGCRGLWTAGDKVEVFDEVLALWDAERDGNGKGEEEGKGGVVTVYLGDSSTDLGCLLRADVGVVVGGNRELGETLGRLGVRLVDGMEGAGRGGDDEEGEENGWGKRLYRVEDLEEVLRWLEVFERGEGREGEGKILGGVKEVE